MQPRLRNRWLFLKKRPVEVRPLDVGGAARVVASAGSPDKVRYLVDELEFDAAFNYRDGPVREQLRTAAPDGIDVYFDNVGGEHLEAAISALNLRGRIAICGMISQ